MQEVDVVATDHRVTGLKEIEELLLVIKLQGDAVLCETFKELVTRDPHWAVVPASELAAHVEELSETLIMILAYCSNVLEYVVGPEVGILDGLDISEIGKLLAELTIRDSAVAIFIKDC